MYLEGIKLINYRLFNHKITVENFCPGVNILVGPSGSGKSSLFSAFQLLISGRLVEIKRELSTRDIFSDIAGPNSFLMVQLCINNSEKDFRIKERTIIIKRLITSKIDKVWVSKFDLETKKINEFLTLNGLNLKGFFLFLTEKEQLYLRLSDSSNILKFLRRNSNLLNFSKNQFRITILLKKATVLKKKVLKIIKLSTKNRNLIVDKEKINDKKSKINYFFIIMEKIMGEFYFNFLSNFIQVIFSKTSKSEFKVVNIKNKENIVRGTLFPKNFRYFPEHFFAKKNHKSATLSIEIRYLSLIYEKKKFLVKLEKVFSLSVSKFSEFVWEKIMFKTIKHIIHSQLYQLRFKISYRFWVVNYENSLKRILNFKLKHEILKKSFKTILDFREKFNIHGNKKNLSLMFVSNYNFTRDIFFKKKRSLQFSEQLSYEINFVEKILINKEKILSKFFGAKVSKSIRIISDFTKSKGKYVERITGILLDLISVYKYFVKPIEIFLWSLFPSLIVQDKTVHDSIISELNRTANTNLNLIINKEYKRNISINLKHPKMIKLNSIIFSTHKISNLVENLIANTYLCTESRIANKISKNWVVTTITLEGEIFYSNNVISSKFLNSNNSLIRESVLLKKERNFLKFMLISMKKLENFDKDFNKSYKKQRKFELVNLEITQFLLFQKTKQNRFLREKFLEHYLKVTLKKKLIDFLKSLNYLQKKFLIQKRVLEIGLNKRIKLRREQNNTLKRVETRNFFNLSYMSSFFKEIKKISRRELNSSKLSKTTLTINDIENLNFKTKDFGRIFSTDVGKFLIIFKYRIKNISFFLNHYYCLTKEITIEKYISFLDLLKYKKIEIHKLKLQFLHLIKIKRKIKRFSYQKINQNSKESNHYILELIVFFQNLEINLNILYQTVDVLLKEKNLKFKKISKIFSYSFQKNLATVLPYAKCCFVWKEKRIQKVFKFEVLSMGIFKNVDFLIKFEENSSFCLIANMSKGQFCFSILIFSITFYIIVKKASFFLDEIDVNMDFNYEILSSKLLKKFSSRGIQFFIITNKKIISALGDKWYGILVSKKGSLMENITYFEAERFFTIKN